MHPLRLNGIEPGTFGWQQEGQDAHDFPRALDQLVVLPDPGAHHQAFVPRGILPDQQPVALALSLQALTAPVQEQDADRAYGTPCDETHPEFRAVRLLLRSLLPQDAVACQRLGVRIPLLPDLLVQPCRIVYLPEAIPEHIIGLMFGDIIMTFRGNHICHPDELTLFEML